MNAQAAGAASAAAGTSSPESSPVSAGVFSRRTVIAMILVGALSFAAFFVLTAYAPDLRSGSDGRTHALSKSAVGFAGIVVLLRERGAPVVIRRGRDTDSGDELLVVTPPVGATADLDDLLSPTTPTLIVLPKWNTIPDLAELGWVREAGLVDEGIVARTIPSRYGKFAISRTRGERTYRVAAVDPDFAFGPALATGPIRGFQTIAGSALVPVLEDKDGRTVLGRFAGADIYVLADPDLLNTHGLANFDTAWLGAHTLETLAGPKNPIHFDVTLYGFERTRNILKLAFEPPFLSATLCALAAAILMGLHAAARFGPPRRSGRVFALGKKALVDNSAALVRMTRREARMAHGYAALTLASAAQAVGGRRGATPDMQAQLLDRLSQTAKLPHTYTELAQAADAVEDRASLLDAARALHAWRTEMTRESS